MNRVPIIVVLGGKGFIGNHLSRALLNLGNKVRIFDKQYSSDYLIEDIKSNVEIVEGDYSRPKDVLGVLEGADICYHLIHTTVPGSSMQDPVFDVQSNVVASIRWLIELNKTSIKKIIYISSGGTIYGIPQTNPITEEHPTYPISSYGITKLCIEKYIALYSKIYGIDYRIVRPSNVYGEGQRLNINQGVIGVFVDKVFHSEPVEVWGDGQVRRDYLYISDFISALLILLNYEGPNRIFNISSGKGYTILEIIEIIERITNKKIKIKFLPNREFDVPHNVLSYDRFRNETGWMPKVNLYEGILNYVEWYTNLIFEGKK